MNPFEAVAERQVAAPVKRLQARIENKKALSNNDAPMVGTLQEREQERQAKQFRWYKVYLREQRQALLDGPFGVQASSLAVFLKNMAPEDAPSLVEMIAESDWPQRPRRVRQEVLRWCDDAISHLRIVNGLAPFDDALIDEPPTAFLVLRLLLQPDRRDA